MGWSSVLSQKVLQTRWNRTVQRLLLSRNLSSNLQTPMQNFIIDWINYFLIFWDSGGFPAIDCFKLNSHYTRLEKFRQLLNVTNRSSNHGLDTAVYSNYAATSQNNPNGEIINCTLLRKNQTHTRSLHTVASKTRLRQIAFPRKRGAKHISRKRGEKY